MTHKLAVTMLHGPPSTVSVARITVGRTKQSPLANVNVGNDTEKTADNTLSTILPTWGTVDQAILPLVVVSPVSALLNMKLGLVFSLVITFY
jgi:hypothetical protein